MLALCFSRYILIDVDSIILSIETVSLTLLDKKYYKARFLYLIKTIGFSDSIFHTAPLLSYNMREVLSKGE